MVQRYGASGWTTCRDTGYVYSSSVAFGWVAGVDMGTASDCGSGSYRAIGYGAFYQGGSWRAGPYVTPSAWLGDHPPRGLAYLATTSYTEMGEWALPAEEGREFGRVLHEAEASGRPEARWLRGAPWRSFLVKYREANDAHKQMLRASAAVHAMAPWRPW